MVLADMLATGRTRWLNVNGTVLATGELRQGHITWDSETGESCGPGWTPARALPC